MPVGAGNEPLWSAHFNFGSSYSFYDVHPTDYCYDAVKWAVDNEITMGTTPTTFEPKKRALAHRLLLSSGVQPVNRNRLECQTRFMM